MRGGGEMWKANETLKRFKGCWDSVHATNHSEASRMLIGQDKLMGVKDGRRLAGDNKRLWPVGGSLSGDLRHK